MKKPQRLGPASEINCIFLNGGEEGFRDAIAKELSDGIEFATCINLRYPIDEAITALFHEGNPLHVFDGNASIRNQTTTYNEFRDKLYSLFKDTFSRTFLADLALERIVEVEMYYKLFIISDITDKSEIRTIANYFSPANCLIVNVDPNPRVVWYSEDIPMLLAKPPVTLSSVVSEIRQTLGASSNV